ncbi:MAG: M23 family metallopeptidase [Spirochaetaceae bacterium]|jgi:murein DD-endopeptidase MepM/ murein hydrolase activator NlpD|nr:M23 family metallopeptidase [Spirochaetaceae bacterium]
MMPVAAEDQIHIVKNGETVYSMARRYGVSVDDILLVNGIDDPRKVQVGQRLRIPSGSLMAGPVTAASVQTHSHKVSKGETLTGIARTYGLSLGELRKQNNLSANYVLKTGDVLKISALTLPASSVLPLKSEAPQTLSTKKPAKTGKTAASPIRQTLLPTVPQGQWPLNAKESAYISGKLSPGMVLTGERNESVRSVSSGTVVSAGPYRGFGRVVIVKSDRGYDYFYGGCETLSVQKGDRVVPGMEMGRLGISALTSKPQLTFMVYHNQRAIDPATAPRA